MAKQIISYFPKDIKRYVEAFGGGGSVLFAGERHAEFEVYNDANSMLVNLFRCIKYHPDELRRELQFRLNSREVFQDFHAQMDLRGLTDIQRAAIV